MGTVVNVMREIGVDAAGLIDVCEHIFGDNSHHTMSPRPRGLSFENLVELVCALSGANSATVRDVIDMRQVVMRQLLATEEAIEKQFHSLHVSVSKFVHGLS